VGISRLAQLFVLHCDAPLFVLHCDGRCGGISESHRALKSAIACFTARRSVGDSFSLFSMALNVLIFDHRLFPTN
jgi:hypothetical protein